MAVSPAPIEQIFNLTGSIPSKSKQMFRFLIANCGIMMEYSRVLEVRSSLGTRRFVLARTEPSLSCRQHPHLGSFCTEFSAVCRTKRATVYGIDLELRGNLNRVCCTLCKNPALQLQHLPQNPHQTNSAADLEGKLSDGSYFRRRRRSGFDQMRTTID